MRLVKKVTFSMPVLTHCDWQQAKGGTGLRGQLPFTEACQSPVSGDALKATMPACVQHIGLSQCNLRLAPPSFQDVVK